MLRFPVQFDSISSLALILLACSPASGKPASASLDPATLTVVESSPASAPQHSFTRPQLVGHSGQYFRWETPAGWKCNETSNGVDMTSPDGKLLATSAVLFGSVGQTDPWDFLNRTLSAVAIRSLRRISTRDLPPQPSGYPGISYRIQAFEVTFTDPALGARHGECTVGVCNAFGSFSVAMQAYSTPPNRFEEGKTWLPLLPDSVRPIDPARIGNQNTLLMPRNHPLDNSSIMAGWQARRASQDRINQKQHETTMGYERMVSPIDGRHYNMPFENYDGTMGGYRDPADRTRILKHAPPGE